MGRCAEAQEAGDIKEQIWLVLDWVNSSRDRDQPRWIVPLGAEGGGQKRGAGKGEEARGGGGAK